MLFIDLLVFRDIKRFFVKSNELRIVEYGPNNKKVHPDAKLANGIQNTDLSNNYIGVSHLCCPICSIFLIVFHTILEE